MIVAWILLGLFLAAGLYLFLVAPRLGRRARLLSGRMYAHRGLHGAGVAENSERAFRLAMEAGLGIELDVRFTKDREVVVFHDDDLARVMNVARRVDDLTLGELLELSLPGGEGIPLFREALKCVGGRAPLLVEIKTCRGVEKLCQATWALLKEYPGEYVVESFNPLALRWFKKHAPGVVRGQLVAEKKEYASTLNAAGAALLCGLMANFLSRPDFVAYEISRQRDFPIRLMRRFFRLPLAAWTIHSRLTLRHVLDRGEAAIFEAGRGEHPIDPQSIR